MLSFFVLSFVSQSNVEYSDDNFKVGEYIKYRVHYNLLPFNAGFATLKVKEEMLNGKAHYHFVGHGGTTGAAKAFYKVDDRYESYIDKQTKKPSKFIRIINEGGHTKDKELTFDHQNKTVRVNNKKHKQVSFERFNGEIQDMISAFYYLRNYDTSNLKTGDFIDLNIFFDEETFKLKLKILGRETKNTKFGRIKCIKIRPYVKSGDLFKSKESVTMWVTDDKNHIPVKIKAKIAVGSLNADLDAYSNIKHPLAFKK